MSLRQIGRELIELKEAHDKGALSDADYEKLKAELMQGGPVAKAELRRGAAGK